MHFFYTVRGKTKDLTNSESFILNREYVVKEYFDGSDLNYLSQVNCRRVRIVSITVPIEHDAECLMDLSPLNHGSNKLKNSLKHLAYFFQKTFSLNVVPPHLNMRKVDNEFWRVNRKIRSYINIFYLGSKDFIEGGVTMRKRFVLMESQRKFSDVFLTWLENRKYKTTLPNKPFLPVSPDVREWRLFDATTYESCKGQLLQDLAPYKTIDEVSGKWMSFLYSIGRRLIGVEAPEKSPKGDYSKFPFNRKAINLYLLAEKEDVKLLDPDARVYRENM